MMMSLTCDVLRALEGKTLSVAESCTGGMIGAALTAVPGSSRVFMGGVISYTNEIKEKLLQVSPQLLDEVGAVSAPVAESMAEGVKKLTGSDCAVAVTGLAGPGGDAYGNLVGTVYIAYTDAQVIIVEKHIFSGDREQVRHQAVDSALNLILKYNREVSI